MNVLIVGSGIIGLASGLECASRGMRTTIVDAGAIPSPAASSHDVHRLFRYPYGPLRGYARLVPAAWNCWTDLFETIGEQYFIETGTLAIGDPSTGWVPHSVASMRELGVRFERLSREEARERYPIAVLHGGKDVLYTPSGGVLLADRILHAMATRARTMGVRLIPDVSVTPEQLPDLAARETADAVVIATGAWSALPSAYGEYPVTAVRQCVAYLSAPPSAYVSDENSRCPMILDLDETSGFYLVPSVAGTPAKVGDHLPGRPDTDGAARVPDRHEKARIVHLIRTGLRDAPTRDLTFSLCRYAMTPVRRFVLREEGTLPGAPSTRVLIAGGGSGHGFKFGPLLGRLAADILDGSIPPERAASIAAGRAGRNEVPYLR
ncbi:MAG: FAD-dependent oxidoreductase [Rhodothermales bacterium]|nr:FAD-dependent oxidoreductase [Rhodothermales bacterium]